LLFHRRTGVLQPVLCCGNAFHFAALS
ncbi:MAG: hypothetical protein K0R85_1617, partial [Devosia sp.]|nr:hypothetical protein [Devosia sp.]